MLFHILQQYALSYTHFVSYFCRYNIKAHSDGVVGGADCCPFDPPWPTPRDGRLHSHVVVIARVGLKLGLTLGLGLRLGLGLGLGLRLESGLGLGSGFGLGIKLGLRVWDRVRVRVNG
jgi:hypothetical protein